VFHLLYTRSVGRKRNLISTIVIFITLFVLLPGNIIYAQSQELTSSNYKILDPTVDAGGGVSTSTNYDLIFSVEPTADARLTSSSYAIGSGFPNGKLANVPKIRCAESTTTSGTTTCINFPNANGAQGECGTPGCYDRIKVEIDHQNNPIDTLYLVSLVLSGTTYYVQSDHTLSATFDINDFMTICGLEGKDTRTGSDCENSAGGQWNADYQSYNVYGLRPGATYTVSAAALSGDFTGTQFGPTTNVTLEYPRITFDIDIAGTGGVATETAAPYSIALGTLTTSPSTATNRIWLDLNTNVIEGMATYVKDVNDGLLSGANLIPSSFEDLAVDTDGGYGLKVETSTQSALGPIVRSSNYDTFGGNEVGGLSTVYSSIFSSYTSSPNTGQVSGGRTSTMVKAKIITSTPAGLYTDTIIFLMITNF